MSEDLKRIEAVLDQQVRPALRAHGGEIQIDHLEDGVLYVKLLGQCAGCPSADLTNETLVEAEVVKALPEQEKYKDALEVLEQKSQKAKKRQAEAKAHARNVRTGKKKHEIKK